PAEHPIRMEFEDARVVASAMPEKTEGAKGLVAPSGSTFLLDGRPWTEAAATLDRPHVFQELKDGKQIVSGAIIESNEFPKRYLVAEGAKGGTTSSNEG